MVIIILKYPHVYKIQTLFVPITEKPHLKYFITFHQSLISLETFSSLAIGNKFMESTYYFLFHEWTK